MHHTLTISLLGRIFIVATAFLLQLTLLFYTFLYTYLVIFLEWISKCYLCRIKDGDILKKGSDFLKGLPALSRKSEFIGQQKGPLTPRVPTFPLPRNVQPREEHCGWWERLSPPLCFLSLIFQAYVLSWAKFWIVPPLSFSSHHPHPFSSHTFQSAVESSVGAEARPAWLWIPVPSLTSGVTFSK